MRLILSLVVALLVSGTALARCEPFDFYRSIGRIPAIVHGRVTQSNKDEVLAATCSPQVCRHWFEVDVIEVLKGKAVPATLRFKYDFVAQRPEISLFATGEEYIFALRKVAADGSATLLGTTCRRTGQDISELEKVKRALKKK
jgi:hypothetical protein